MSYIKLKNGEIELKVLLHNRPYLRDDNLEFKFMVGYSCLKKIFDNMIIDESIKRVELYFPERNINILEQRQLLGRIFTYFPNINWIYIETHSPFIVQSIPNGHVFVVQYENQVKDTSNHEIKLYNFPLIK